MPDEPGAVWIPTSNFFPNRYGYSPSYVVIHGTAGGSNAEDIATFFQSTEGGNNPASSHYIIGQNGEVVQCVNETDGAWGNGVITGPSGTSGNGYGNGYHDTWWDNGINPNNITVSIEHAKPSTDNSDTLTDVQKNASFTLVRDICVRNNIPQRQADANGGLTGHYAIDPVNRARCPGPYPWDELYTFLAQGGSMVPQGWSDDGTTLTAPNGITVVHGFRDYVLNNGWDPNNWPLEEEHGQTPLELSNPGIGGGTQQIFRTMVLEWAPSRNVFTAWGGQELLKLRALLAACNGKVAKP